MVIKKILLLFGIYFSFFLKSQNMISNGGFEKHLDCPFSYTKIHEKIPSLLGWIQYGDVTPDYFNSCSEYVGIPKNFLGFQKAYHGNAYAGFISYEKGHSKYRELIGCKLTKKLKRNELYYIQFQVSLADKNNIGTNHIHAYLNSGNIGLRKINNLTDSVIIQDTSSWVTIKSFFYSNGNEEYIYIGNLENKDSIKFSCKWNKKLKYSYYYLDNVYLIEVNKNLCTKFKKNDSIIVLNRKLPFNFNDTSFFYNLDSINVKTKNTIFEDLAYFLKENPLTEVKINLQLNNNFDEYKKKILITLQNINDERITYELNNNPNLINSNLAIIIKNNFDNYLFNGIFKN
jgi:OOP family OmpA-OmpF porin